MYELVIDTHVIAGASFTTKSHAYILEKYFRDTAY